MPQCRGAEAPSQWPAGARSLLHAALDNLKLSTKQTQPSLGSDSRCSARGHDWPHPSNGDSRAEQRHATQTEAVKRAGVRDRSPAQGLSCLL